MDQTNTGLEVLELQDDPEFAGPRLRTGDLAIHLDGLGRLAKAFVDKPDTVLQELVNAAVELCGADSAGISLEQEHGTDQDYYRWVATAGKYAHFLNATLPRTPSACGVCLDRGRPQRFRVSQRFFDLLGVEAPLVSDGLLLPWHAGEVRGTIFIMAHGRTDAFDAKDLALMEVLADFAAMVTRHQCQQEKLVRQATLAAAAAMANDLAHEINNPLQSLTNLVYLAAGSTEDGQAVRALAQQLSEHVARLSELVSGLLALPIDASRAGQSMAMASAAPEHLPAAR